MKSVPAWKDQQRDSLAIETAVPAVFYRVRTLLAELLDIPETAINENLAMADLDAWDSLKHMELVASIETEFQIQLTFEEIVTMTSVGRIARVLTERGVADLR